jgi:hypothetical protein
MLPAEAPILCRRAGEGACVPETVPSPSPSPNRPGVGSALRFATELVAWIATPWALASHSVPLAVAAVAVLVGLPAIFSTPGDKAKVLVPVSGYVTVALVVMQLVAAVTSAWIAWPAVVAVAVTILVAVTVLTELPRWRWLVDSAAGGTGRQDAGE